MNRQLCPDCEVLLLPYITQNPEGEAVEVWVCPDCDYEWGSWGDFDYKDDAEDA